MFSTISLEYFLHNPLTGGIIFRNTVLNPQLFGDKADSRNGKRQIGTEKLEIPRAFFNFEIKSRSSGERATEGESYGRTRFTCARRRAGPPERSRQVGG